MKLFVLTVLLAVSTLAGVSSADDIAHQALDARSSAWNRHFFALIFALATSWAASYVQIDEEPSLVQGSRLGAWVWRISVARTFAVLALAGISAAVIITVIRREDTFFATASSVTPEAYARAISASAELYRLVSAPLFAIVLLQAAPLAVWVRRRLPLRKNADGGER